MKRRSWVHWAHICLLILLAVGQTLVASPSAEKYNGVGGRGGGNAVAAGPNQPLLLVDIFSQDPFFQDNYRKAEPLVRPVAGEERGLRIFVADQPAYALVQERLSAWQAGSPASRNLLKLISESLATMQFFVSEKELKPQPGLFLPMNILTDYPDLLIKPIVSYLAALGGGIISARVWQKLGYWSQAGLLIHEALRDIQIQMQIEGLNPSSADQQDLAPVISDQEIQLITYQILLGEPTSSVALDKAESYSGFLKRLMATKKNNKEILVSSCHKIKNSVSSPSCKVLENFLKTFCSRPDLTTDSLISEIETAKSDIASCSYKTKGDDGIDMVEQELEMLRDIRFEGLWANLHQQTRAWQQMSIDSRNFQDPERILKLIHSQEQ